MELNDKIRWLLKELVTTYVKFVKCKVDEEDKNYIKMNIDNDFDVYKDLCIEVLRKVLESKRIKMRRFPRKAVNECMIVVESKLLELGMYEFAIKYNEVIIDTCDLVFKKIEEGLREDGCL